MLLQLLNSYSSWEHQELALTKSHVQQAMAKGTRPSVVSYGTHGSANKE